MGRSFGFARQRALGFVTSVAAVAAILCAGTGHAHAIDEPEPEVFDLEFNRFCTQTSLPSGAVVPGLDEDYALGAPDERWTDLRARSIRPGGAPITVTDGVVTVEIRNFTGTSFDWESSLPLDGVFVNAGSATDGTAAHRFYRYAPEAKSDLALTSATGHTQIDHVSFCYDLPSPSQTADHGRNVACHETQLPSGTIVDGLDRIYGETWDDLRFGTLSASQRTYSATRRGLGTIEIWSFDGYSFDWTSTVPIDAVIVHAGSAPNAHHRSYRYAPEATSDAGVTSSTGTTPINKVTFCYDLPSPSQVLDLTSNRYCHDKTLATGFTVPGLDTQFGEIWQGPRRSNLATAPASFVVTDGTVTVQVTNFDGFSFDWTSDLPLDGVFVNAGSSSAGTDAHRFYRYVPEATSDVDVSSSTGTTRIDHIQFCYDGGSPADVFDLPFNRLCHTKTLPNGVTVPGLDDEYGGGETWVDLRANDVDELPIVPSFVVTDGTVTVQVTNFDGFSFDWTSDLPLDGVFVNAGSSTAGTDAHRFYRYVPEATSDSGLSSSDGVTPVEHISFCYDIP